MKPLVIRMERGAALLRIHDQQYYYNTVIQSDAGVEIWSFTGGKYRKIRRSDRDMINPDPSIKRETKDHRKYDVYFVDKNRMETGDSDSLYIQFMVDGELVTAYMSFAYRIVDAPSLIGELRLSKRQYSHVALKNRIYEAILDVVEKYGCRGINADTLRGDIARYGSELYTHIRKGYLLAYLGVELESLKLTIR